jgi:hypothetical protein
MNSFPNKLKKELNALVGSSHTDDEQLLIIYYNKYKNSTEFSLGHLRNIIETTIGSPLPLIINTTDAWNIKSINGRIIDFMIQWMLTH